MKSILFPAVAVLCLTSVTALAQSDAPSTPKPITDQSVSAGDVAKTPMSDLGMRKTAIPPLLVAAQENPYTLAGLRTCPAIASVVGELNAVLGDDIDMQQTASRKLSAGVVAQSVVANFIPFRGVIRELSGANNQDRRVQSAIYAGTARRAFLKGVGLQRGCAYPARPASMTQSMSAQPAPSKAPARARSPKRTYTGGR